MAKKTKWANVPAEGKKWVKGTLLRDRDTGDLVKVAPGRTVHYHGDRLAVQRVTAVRSVPESYAAARRLVSIIEGTLADGAHTPESRGASASAHPAAPAPTTDAEAQTWTAQRDRNSLASYPTVTVRGDVVTAMRPVYDDSPVVAWVEDATLAEEVRTLIGQTPSLCRYPEVTVTIREEQQS